MLDFSGVHPIVRTLVQGASVGSTPTLGTSHNRLSESRPSPGHTPITSPWCGKMIAALFVQEFGAYWRVEGIDCWGKTRDARTYSGPYPVIAHPPCSRWCQIAGVVEARYGYKRGMDGGCFKAALESVRKWGGVLEHPAHSKAWEAFGLNKPPSSGGWVNADFDGGWTCQVEQGRYGHPARKATWGCSMSTLDPQVRFHKYTIGPITRPKKLSKYRLCAALGAILYCWSHAGKAGPSCTPQIAGGGE